MVRQQEWQMQQSNEEAVEIWHQRKELIERALKVCGDPANLNTVAGMVHRGEALFWALGDSACVTTFRRYNVSQEGEEVDVCHIWAAGGSLDDLVRMEEQIEDWARAQGADRLTITGRPGWKKALPGYKQTAILLQKDLSDERQ